MSWLKGQESLSESGVVAPVSQRTVWRPDYVTDDDVEEFRETTVVEAQVVYFKSTIHAVCAGQKMCESVRHCVQSHVGSNLKLLIFDLGPSRVWSEHDAAN